jgi:thioredoxin reductase (NADPH)
MEEANFLTKFASRVHLIHRRKEFRASKIMHERARMNEKVNIVAPVVVEQVVGASKGALEGVELRNVETNEKSTLPIEGIFIAIGHDPNTKVFRGKLEMDPEGYLIAKNGSHTNVPGVFVAGDVQDRHYRQAVTAAGSGCMAALDAERFLEVEKHD